MQTRRHLVVAAAAATVLIASLAIATDMLGADVSHYATPSETIEATGTEKEPSDEESPDQALADKDDWAAFDIAVPTPDEPVAGPDDLPEQLAVVDDTAERSEVEAKPTVNHPPAGETAIGTPTGDRSAESVAAEPAAGPGTTVGTPGSTTTSSTPSTSTETSSSGIPVSSGPVPLQEVPTGAIAPIAAAKVSSTTSTPSTSTSNSSSTPTSTSTSNPGDASNPVDASKSGSAANEDSTVGSTTTGSTNSTTTNSTTTTTTSASPTTTTTVVKAETSAVAQPTIPTTTWLPITTNTPITTWLTTTAPATTAPVVTIPTGGSGSTSSPPTTQPSTTRPSTTVASTTTAAPTTGAPTTAAPSAGGSGSNEGFSAIANNDPRFSRYDTVPSASLNLADLTEPAPVKDNGTVGDGQFRAACQYSHFAYDDPIVYPGQPGRSHLHMFFGNTRTNAHSNTNSIVNSGGSSCNGFELNRSAYWTPALLDGRGNAVVPDMIILYYKSKEPGQVQRMPQGLKMVSGNTSAESFTANDFLYWSCGDSGHSYNKSNRIPDCNGDTVNATISFPQCWDGRNMDSADHRSHMALVSPHKPCPSTHPVRLPQISILLYFPGDQGTKGWYLSSDRSGGFNTGPGATLHADWWGGWNDEAMDLWTNGCMKAARNCSFGQTGTDRQLAKLNNFQNYQGPNFLPLP